MSTSFNAQDYSKFYYPFSNFSYNGNSAAYVIQKFEPSTLLNSTLNYEGTIMTQRVVDPLGEDAIQITLVDADGKVVKGMVVFYGETGTYTPVCAAYNNSTNRYCIAGINEESAIGTSPTISWFLFLDQELNFLDARKIGVDIDVITQAGGEADFFVTDITSVVGSANEFEFVGVAGHATDPTPANNSSATIKKTMYMNNVLYDAGTSQATFGNGRAFDFSNASPIVWDVNNQYFPSRLIEINMASPDGGLMVTGSGERGSLFFTRTDYGYSNNGASELFVRSPLLFAGDLYFDPVEEEVWFAGTTNYSDYPGLIYQKAVNLTSAGTTLYSAIGSCLTSSNWFLAYKMYTETITPFIKVSKIMPAYLNNEAAIVANAYESAIYYNAAYTITYPGIHRLGYSNTAFNTFCTTGAGQYPDLYTYPRWYGNNGVGTLPYLAYPNKHFPAHTAHPFRWGSFMDETYVLGSSTFDPVTGGADEHISLNRTSGFAINYCMMDQQGLLKDNFSTSNLQVTPGDLLNDITGPYSLSFTTDFTELDVVVNDCFDDLFFKATGVPIAPSFFEKKYTVRWDNENIIISSSIQEGNYKIYNTSGAVVFKGKIQNGYARNDISSFAQGMYLVDIENIHHKRMGVKKIMKN